jgi:hypothetical protein
LAKDFADTVRGKFRRLSRPNNTALLIKHGVIDEEGDLRKEGRYAILQHMFDNNVEGVKDRLVEMTTAVEKDENPKSRLVGGSSSATATAGATAEDEADDSAE